MMEAYSIFDEDFPKEKFIVMSESREEVDYENIYFVNSLDSALRKINEMWAENILIAGWTKLNTYFLERELLNEIIIDVEPFIFAKWKPLFDDSNMNLRLSLKERNKTGKDSIQLKYEVHSRVNNWGG